MKSGYKLPILLNNFFAVFTTLVMILRREPLFGVFTPTCWGELLKDVPRLWFLPLLLETKTNIYGDKIYDILYLPSLKKAQINRTIDMANKMCGLSIPTSACSNLVN